MDAQWEVRKPPLGPGWLAGVGQAPLVGCEDQDLLWGGGSCGDMENQGKGRGGTQRRHAGGCQLGGEWVGLAQCQGTGS